MTERTESSSIGTVPAPACPLCGEKGYALYRGLPDRLFGAPGAWDFKRCPKGGCGLIWLDPMPSGEEIGKAYRNYYTHQAASVPAPDDAVGGTLLKAYERVDRFVSRITGLSELKRRIDAMYLDDVAPGRLLDVGCGDGTFLVRMREYGWAVEGVEVDPEAAEFAIARHRLRVHRGTLESARFPDDSFDAVCLNHVIEHVHEPVALLAECRRILRTGGRVVVATPNTESLGHRVFRADWYALDPPRHLILHSRATLAECATRAGFRDADVWCTPARASAVLPGSVYNRAVADDRTRLRSKVSRTLRSFVLQYREHFLARRNTELGEEAVLLGRKA